MYINYITVSAFTSTKITSVVISPEEHPDAAPCSKPFPGKLFHVVVVTIHLLALQLMYWRLFRAGYFGFALLHIDHREKGFSEVVSTPPEELLVLLPAIK